MNHDKFFSFSFTICLLNENDKQKNYVNVVLMFVTLCSICELYVYVYIRM